MRLVPKLKLPVRGSKSRSSADAASGDAIGDGKHSSDDEFHANEDLKVPSDGEDGADDDKDQDLLRRQPRAIREHATGVARPEIKAERKVFKIHDEQEKPREDFVVGDAQKVEVKSVTGTWLNYFNEKQINGVLYNAMRSLLHLLELPENPFAFLSNQLRISELFYSVTHTDYKEFKFNQLAEEDPTTKVTQVVHHDLVWGLRNLLYVVDPAMLTELWDRIEFACPHLLQPNQSEQGDYFCKLVNALTGAAVLHGSVLPYLPSKIEIKEDCKVSGPKFEKAVGIFANQIMSEVFAIGLENPNLVIGVFIEKTPHLKAGGQQSRTQKRDGSRSRSEDNLNEDYRLWPLAKIKSSKTSFQSAVKAATVSSREIVLRFMVELPELEPKVPEEEEDKSWQLTEVNEYDHNSQESDPLNDSEDYGDFASVTGRQQSRNGKRTNRSGGKTPIGRIRTERGQFIMIHKTYSLHFQLVDKEGQPSGPLRSFALFPFSSLCSGIFRTRKDAVFYAELFKTEDGVYWTLDNQQDFHAPFRASLKAELVKLYIAGNLIAAVEILTILACIARRYAVIPDVIRLMRSQVGRLYGLSIWNTAMQDVLMHCRADADMNRYQEQVPWGAGSKHERHGGFDHHHLVDKVVQQFWVYKRELLKAVHAAQSTEIATLSLPIRHKLYIMSDHISQRLIVNSRTTCAALEHVNDMCKALILTVSRDMVSVLASDSLHETHVGDREIRPETIVALIDEVIEQALVPPPDEVAKGRGSKLAPKDTRSKRRSSISEDGPILGAETSSSFDIFSSAGLETMEAFSNEVNAARRAREHVRVVSVPNAIKAAKKKRNVPASIAREAVILEYVTETRIDKVLREIVLDVFNNGKLYPNPYPLIVARLRAEVSRHALWREADPELLRRVTTSRARMSLCNARCYLYKSAKVELYGLVSTMRGCEEDIIVRTMSTLEASGAISPVLGPNCMPGEHPGAAPQSTSNARTAYEISVNTSIGGSLVLYSRMFESSNATQVLRQQPNVTLFETHVYEGPHCTEALDVQVSHVIAHALYLNDKSASNVLLGLLTGQHAMDAINEDQSFDGGWRSIQTNERHRTTGNREVREEEFDDSKPALLSGRKNTVIHDAEFFVSMRDKLYHPKYSHGAILSAQRLRRDKALCKQELIRATEAREPIVVRMAVLFNDSEDKSRPFFVVVNKIISFYFVQSPAGNVKCFAPSFMQYEALYQSLWTDIDQAVTAIQAMCTKSAEGSNSARELGDPRDPSNPIYVHYSESLKLRVAHAYSRGYMAVTYRAMLRLALLDSLKDYIPDLLRMFKRESLALELDKMVAVSDAISALLAERYRSEESRAKLKGKVLQRLYKSYKQHVEVVLARADCVFFPGIRNAVHALLLKVQNAIHSDRIGTSTQHLESLEELQIYLECIRISAAGSVHRNCPHIDILCRRFCKELLPISHIF